MSAFNIVRMKVKPGFEDTYLEFHRKRALNEHKGLKAFHVVKTGDREFVLVGEWRDMEALAAARPAMIATLDQFRDKLEDLGNGLGVTDPRSGEVVVERVA
jgi:quinol monooxygenase YgiN